MTMQHFLAFLVLACAAVVSAHFQLQFPAPRGVFNEGNEPKFCDGYNTAASNRTLFPLSGGIFSLNSEHPTWTAAVLLSTDENPTSFNNFKQVKPFFQLHGEGIFCLPLDFSANSNSSSLQNGQNVTVQIIFDGGDGALFQCADLTVSSDANLASTPCSNATGSSSVTGSATSAGTTSPSVTSASSNSPSPKPSNAGGPTNELRLGSLAALLGMLGIVTAMWYLDHVSANIVP